ncbi:MAG: DUF2189 domain-containing protein [Sphingorhabdus sp.]
MTVSTQSQIAPVTVARDLTARDMRAALAAGWRDFVAQPMYGLFFAAFYVVGGFVLILGLFNMGKGWWLIPVMAGFPLLAPFSAVGLYEVSRRREVRLPLSWGGVLSSLRGHGDEQLPMMGGIVFVAFSFWMILAHGIFAIFLGDSGIGGGTGSLLFSADAITMLLVGSLVGGLFALALFAITVVSLPMLVDREVDFITAIIVSLGVVRSNKGVMLGWAVLIAALLTIAMLPMFLGLFVALPVLGHATWHIYRRAVCDFKI